MNRERWEQVKQIFGEALEQDPAKREAFLHTAAKGDTGLLSELLRLLAESDRDSEFLSRPALGGASLFGPEETPRFTSATILGGRYQVIRFIARGGMGEVYEAEDLELGGRVAIKVIRQSAVPAGELPALMKNEVQLARRVTHPNVCRIFDVIQHDGVLLLSMELIEGRTLSAYLREAGPVNFREALPLIEEIAAGLQAIHNAGIIHGDLKPGNIMLASSYGDRRPKAVVMDFGMALPVTPRPDAPVRRGGTPEYFAPEQSEGAPISTATDMYALALLIADMLGVPRASRSKPDAERMPAKWAAALRRCLQQDPSLRYTHPADLVKTLQRAAGFRKRAILFACATVGAVILTLGIAALLRQRFDFPASAAKPPILSEGYPVQAVATSENHNYSTLRFRERDWVMLEGFENRTGDPLFDRTLQEALKRELSNSEFVSVAPRERVEDALRLMKQPPDSVLTAAQAREVCLRDGAIRALVTGRTEKVGSTYLVSAEVIDPVQNRTVASDTEAAPGQDQIWPAVRRLSNWVRETLGETMERIDRSNRQLEKATTPSLRALQLFTEANSAILRGEGAVSAHLMRQALIEDPGFASARMLLAWVLRTLGDPEWKTEAQKALELAGSVSERERYFVEGSYELMMDHRDRALPLFEAMARRYPDHFFAYQNLLDIYVTRGSIEDAARLAGRYADARPNDFRANADATRYYLNFDMRRAKHYAQRANSVQPLRMGVPLFFHAHELWMQDDAQGALMEIQHIAARIKNSPDPQLRRNVAITIAGFLLTLGKFKDCQQVIDSLDNSPPGWSALVSFYKGDDERTRQIAEFIESRPEVNPLGLLQFPTFLITRFRPGAEKKVSGETDPNYALVRGEVAIHEGRFEDAVRVLQAEFDDRYSKQHFSAQWIADGLVTALDETGDSAKALEVLKMTSISRMWATPASVYVYQNFWLRDQARLSAHYHRLGLTTEAQKVDDQLRRLLAVADPDHPILRQLNGR